MEKATLSLKIVTSTVDEKDHFTLYVVGVERGGSVFDSWRIQKRYSEFVELQKTLKDICPGLDLPLPPKKLFGSMEKTVVAERELGLQVFLDLLQESKVALWQPEVLKFFGAEDTAGTEFSVNFEKDVMMFMRSQPELAVNSFAPRLGSRSLKGYCLITENKAQKLLALTLKDVEASGISDEQLKFFFGTALEAIQHPLLAPVEKSEYLKEGSAAVVIRKAYPKGSLKDFIHDKPPKGLYSQRYVVKKPGSGLKEHHIRQYGRQILEAVKFLQGIGFPLVHLHTGNVLLDEGLAKLTDFENVVLGLPLREHHWALGWGPSPPSLEDVTVLLFGFLLFEMATAREAFHPSVLDAPSCYPPDLHPEIRKVIESILKPAGKLPTIQGLLEHPVFGTMKLPELAKGQ